MNDNKPAIIVFVLLVLAVSALVFFPPKNQASVEEQAPKNKPVENLEPKPDNEKPMNNNSDIVIDKNKKYKAEITTDAGKMTVELNSKETPVTVNNFVVLSRKGFYDNTIFHRVIKGFMIQGGDPTGTGMGGPGYKFADEPFTGEYDRGVVAMANSGPNTNGSQFFIMHASVPLPKNYVIFGKVVEGLDVLDKIAEAPVKSSVTGEASTPLSPVKILGVVVVEE